MAAVATGSIAKAEAQDRGNERPRVHVPRRRGGEVGGQRVGGVVCEFGVGDVCDVRPHPLRRRELKVPRERGALSDQSA
jgi:hypothetical protein